MALRKNYRTDKTAEVNGVDVVVDTNEHNGQPITFKLSRMANSNKNYTKALEEATRPHMASINAETLDNEVGKKLMRDVFLDSVLLGWSNLPKSELTNNPADKEELPFTRENAEHLFAALPDLYEDLEARARKLATFRAKERDEAAKN